MNGESQVEVIIDRFDDLVEATIAIDSEIASASNEDDGVDGKPGGVLGFREKVGNVDSGKQGEASVPGGV